MTDPSVTDLRMTDTDRVWTFVLLGGGGGALLLVLPWLLDLVSGFPLVPFEAVAEWVAGFDEPWAWAARLAVGGLLGSALAAFAIADEHRILLGDDQLVVVHGSDQRILRREQVVGVHRDGKRLVIDGDHGRVLFDETLEAPRDQVREAFLAHAYPWESA
ncbi:MULTISPECIES: hypothetical protein [unclassified Aeromicrobium]|uniref:YqeB family protein n=1 Tax=unclassified Aeromicrobium TaxID=2633570 RepID=UPI0006FE6528|nr:MULTISPECIES: hypothetical protein [unclassified Aeromicrobium]KQP26688.1 hypothetical protein ASF38_06565 [Aeromicrobium sp. Leaf272]KQP77801.1 hypothetical protein ASF37_03930 [Aeromicrobium sp. Leaf289]